MAIAIHTTSGSGGTAIPLLAQLSWMKTPNRGWRGSTRWMKKRAAGYGQGPSIGWATAKSGGKASATAPIEPSSTLIGVPCRVSWTTFARQRGALTPTILNLSPALKICVGFTRRSRLARRGMNTYPRTSTWTTANAAAGSVCVISSEPGGREPRTNGVASPVAEWIGWRLQAVNR